MILLSLGVAGCAGDADTDTSPRPAACEGSTPIPGPDGEATGYEQCADGTIHRVTAVPTSPLIDGAACAGTEDDLTACTTDADCTDGAYGKCLHEEQVPCGRRESPTARASAASTYCGCSYSCAIDADCGPGQACVPDGVGPDSKSWATCVAADCTTDADCASGECGLSTTYEFIRYLTVLACRDSDDACRTDLDCTSGVCGAHGDDFTYACREVSDCGRPLIVEGRARTAPAEARADWSADLCVGTDALPPDLRRDLAAWWRQIAALEHASVASFARFSLQLLAIGAPPELLAAAQRAASDEIAHARLAYALASAYGDTPVGPGPLSLAELVLNADRPSILRGLIEEACVSETLGAAELRASAAAARDPELRRVLSQIAEDEERHAALAWRTLRWMLEQDPSLRSCAAELFEEAVARARLTAPVSSPEAPEHGVLGPAARRQVQLAALDQVVTPCARLLSPSSAPALDRRRSLS